MDSNNALFLILTIIPAVSFGWGMRGTTIGGEKGAMLPGAIIGTLLALFSGSLIVRENFYVFTALGAIGMYFGGCMTYGETLSFSMSAKPAVNIKKGITALLIKGFLWYAVFGAVFSTGVNAVSGIYNLFELILIFTVTPIFALIFLHIFNRPLNADEMIFPKIYFSKTRKEYWGAMLGIASALLLINTVKLNSYSVIFTLICGGFGAIGWAIGQGIHIFIKHYAHTSRHRIIRFFSEQNNTDGWKAMECTFGAVAGLGCAIAYLITYNEFKLTVYNIEKSGGLIEFNKYISLFLFVLWILLLVADMLHYSIRTKIGSIYFEAYFKIIERKGFWRIFNGADDVSKFKKNLNNIFEAVEFVLYAALPFILITLGDINAAKATSFIILLWVLLQEIAYDTNHEKKFGFLLKTVSCLFIINWFIAVIVIEININSRLLLFLYFAFYEILTLALTVIENIYNIAPQAYDEPANIKLINQAVKKILKTRALVKNHLYFIFCCVITLITI